MEKKVLVTGGCGFIGGNLVRELIKRGYKVDVIDNLYIGKQSKIPEGCNFMGGDIRLIELPETDYVYVFHLAAISRILPSFDFPDLTFNVNVSGTREIINYTNKIGAKLIYAGSSSRHCNPELSPYAMSKHMGEEWIKMFKETYGLKAEIARFYNVYGPGELVDSKMGSVIGIWRSAIKKGEPILIHGDGEQRRDFTHVDDIVDGLIRIAESDEKHEDAWELGTGCNYSLNELAEMFGVTEKKYVDDVKGNYRKTLRLNNDAVVRLGWEPQDRLKKYIQQLYERTAN